MHIDISALYQQYRNELLNHLANMVKCPEIAQDLVQESYIILARTAADVRIEHPRGFLYRTANNLALDHLRHNKVVARHIESAQHEAEQEYPSTENEISKAEWRALLHQVIAELPPRCRDAFILHKMRGLSYREVAQLLDISESAVEKHIVKGLLHCRNRLGKHFSFQQQKN
jgi:RNA polymerase sigma factor (sigma-70 family)